MKKNRMPGPRSSVPLRGSGDRPAKPSSRSPAQELRARAAEARLERQVEAARDGRGFSEWLRGRP